MTRRPRLVDLRLDLRAWDFLVVPFLCFLLRWLVFLVLAIFFSLLYGFLDAQPGGALRGSTRVERAYGALQFNNVCCN